MSIGYDRAIALNPDYAEAYFNKAMTQLLIEDLENGWVNMNGVSSSSAHRTQNVTEEARFRERRWNGKDSIGGKKILIRSEQGYGDTIRFCRYVGLLASLGGHKLGTRVRPRVGLLWRGKLQRGDNRSAELSELVGCLAAGFQYVSLQKEISEHDAGVLETNEIMNCSAEQRDFSDAAALCGCMDVVISIDTSIAHLSGALGKRTWILLPTHPDWRWSRTGAHCPWYATATLYRQSSANEWSEVCTRVFADLAAAFGASGGKHETGAGAASRQIAPQGSHTL